MIHKEEKIEELKRLICGEPRQITVISHTNPDGDAIGSGVAWLTVLKELGHTVKFIVPNAPPQFLTFIRGANEVRSFRNKADEYGEFIKDSDIIFCLDFNQLHRLDELGAAVESNIMATKVLIDHHQEPPAIYDLSFSEVTASSTSYLIYTIIQDLELDHFIDKTAAEALYLGIMTDTGNFSFGNLCPELFEAVASLVRKGVTVPVVNNAVFNTYSECRLRLMGYVISEKMVVIEEHRAAYMSLNQEELRAHNFQMGDSEGFVNLPLQIKNVKMSALFVETNSCIKISLRSQGDIDVNLFARKYFNGGGHKNASGGKSFVSVDQTIADFVKALDEFFAK